MPDPVFRCDFFFEATQSRGEFGSGASIGWTESWYRSFPNIEAAIAAMQNTANANSYLRWRLPLLKPLYACIWVRASSTAQPPGTRLSKVANMGGAGVGSWHANDIPAQTTCGLLINFTSIMPPAVALLPDGSAAPAPPAPRSVRRSFFLRGIPGPFTDGNIFSPNAAYRDALISFLSLLARFPALTAVPPVASPPWLIRTISSPSAAPVGGITVPAPPASPRTFTIIQPAVPLVTGQRVRFTGVTSPAYMNRTWTVLGVTAGGGLVPPTATLGVSRRDIVGTPNATGSFRLLSYWYTPATNVVIIGLRSRKIGRPSHPLRGRRSVAR